MLKRILSALLASLMLLSATACATGNDGDDTSPDTQAKGMIAAMGEPLVTKVVYFEQIKGDQPVPVKPEEIKVGTLCQATISIKLTKDICDKKAGSVEEITPTILIKTEEGWKFMDPMDKETMALLEARVKK